MKWMMSIAIVAISFTGCENNFEDVSPEGAGFELTVVADNLSRTEYDATLDDIKWSAGDKASVIVNGSMQAIEASIDANDSRIASFTYEANTLTAGTALIQGFAPSTSLDVQYEGGVATRYAINLPAKQSATTATFDKSADILVADNMSVAISAEDVAAGKKSVGNFNFHRMVAVSEFTYTVTNATLAASDEKVTSVSFEVVSVGKNLAGNMYVQPGENGAKYVDANGAELSGTNDCFYGAKSGKVTVALTDTPALKDGFTAWFVTAPVTLDADDKLIFTVKTDKGTTITKRIEAVGKELSFSTTQKNTLGVTLNDAVTVEKSIKILAIGNSFSMDAMEYLHGILTDAGYENVVLGNLYKGGCTLEQHDTIFAANSTGYTYYKNTTGTWSSTGSYAPYGALVDEDWDYITMQQGSAVSGVPSSYDPYLANLIGYVTEECPNAELLWHMTWAYQGDSTHSAFPTYGSDQMTMYNAIISTVQSRIVGDSNFVKIIPTGTAVQNMRTSFVGDHLTRDGYHMSYDNGRYLAALTYAKAITGCDLSKVNYTPSQYVYTTTMLSAMKEAVENAMEKPFEVTASTYLTDPDAGNEPTFEDILSKNGYNYEDYEALELDWTKYAYYNSSNGGDLAFKLITKENNSGSTQFPKFVATRMISKSEIPNGSLVVVKNGYQYRPEGWINLSTRNTSSTRPDNVSTTLVQVDNAWWGDWTYRAFNIQSNPVAEYADDAAAEKACESFAIFVPKSGTLSAFEQIVVDNGYNVADFEMIDLGVMPYSYYNSTGSTSAPSKINTGTSGTALKYAATKIFEKSEIPNGSLIVLKSGYQYRPEGWVDLNTKPSKRPDNTTEQFTVVDDTWWGSYNYRGFNLAFVNTPETKTEEEMANICECFAIFVPKAVELTPLQEVLVANGYNPLEYNALDMGWTKFAYYYSTKTDKGYGASQLKDTAYSSGTASKYVATQLFTKSDIPNGSVIVVINSFKYRPEGWTDLDAANTSTTRPGEVSTTLVVVDDAWWGNWNYRGFNVGNGSALTAETAETACASFGIFVPKK